MSQPSHPYIDFEHQTDCMTINGLTQDFSLSRKLIFQIIQVCGDYFDVLEDRVSVLVRYLNMLMKMMTL